MDTPIAVTVEYPRVQYHQRLEHLAGQVGFEIRPLLASPFPDGLDALSYAQSLMRTLDGEERPVGLVIAVCLAAPIGHEVARLVCQRQRLIPTFIALDGAPVSPFDVIKGYQGIVAAYAGPNARSRVSLTETRLREEPQDLIKAIQEELTQTATAVLADDSLRPESVSGIVRGTVNMSMAWILQLVAAHNAHFPAWPGEVVLATSDEAYFQRDWPGSGSTRLVTIGGLSDEMAAHPKVPQMLAAEMASVTARMSKSVG